MTLVHPCASNPYPKSSVQPWLTADRREFIVPAEEIPPDYPYIVVRGAVRYRIPYFEFHGLGPPNDLDVGGPGDVYVDLSPGEKALWGYTAQGWHRCLDICDVYGKPSGNRWIVRHPFFDYSLRISTGGGHHIAWLKNSRSSNVRMETRRWAVQRGLLSMPLVGVRKDEATACREVSAILVELENLENLPQAPALRSPNVLGSSGILLNCGRSGSPSIYPSSPAADWESLNYTIPLSWSPPLEDKPTDEFLKPQHPCFTTPTPVSLVHPEIISRMKKFTAPTCTVSPDYPFHLEPAKGGFQVPYFQFTGRGAPTEELDVGTEGDVYLDVAPDGTYGLYGKTASGWKRWSDTGEALPGNEWPESDWIVHHPYFENHALWVTFSKKGGGSGNICWYRGLGSPKNARIEARKKGLVTKSILKAKRGEMRFVDASNILEYIINGKKPEGELETSSSEIPATTEGSKKKRKGFTKPEVKGESLRGPFSMWF